MADGDDLEGDPGKRTLYKPISNRKIEKGYGRFLAWLAGVGQLNLAQPPGERVTPATIAAYVRDLSKANKPTTLAARLQELYEATLVMAPEENWRWIRRVRDRIRGRHCPPQERPEVPESRKLLELGIVLMEGAPLETTARKAAIQYRDGLIIAFLASLPLRRADLAALQLGKHISQEAGKWRVRGLSSKTGRPIVVAWPDHLVPMLEVYLSVHRSVLARQRKRWASPVGNALWVSGDGSPLSYGWLYACIARRTASVFGGRVGPHRFRHSAATSIAVETPEQVGDIKAVLGHASHTIGSRIYNLAKMTQAVHRFQRVVGGLQDGTFTFSDGEEEAAQDKLQQASVVPLNSTAATPAPVPSPRSAVLSQMGDLTGQTFGRLHVLGLAGRTTKGQPKWQVRCTDCSAEKENRHKALLAIKLPKTGCELCAHLDQLKGEFLTDKIIGGGLVVAYAGRDQHNFHAWLCRCACGAESARPTGNLRWAIKRGRIACRACSRFDETGEGAPEQKVVPAAPSPPTRKGRERVDLVGMANGRLKVVANAESDPVTRQTRVLVECQTCGAQKVMQPGNFKKATRCMACQCMRKDLTGFRSGKLAVLGFAYSRSWKAYWRCQCNCGQEVVLSTNALTHEHQQSCGRCPRGKATPNQTARKFMPNPACT